MAEDFYICIDEPEANIPAGGAQNENSIIHVEFTEPNRHIHKVHLGKLEPFYY